MMLPIKEVAIDKVAPYFRNPRNAAKAVPKVMQSIKEFGWRQPIVVDKDMVIVVGHARYLAAKRLGCAKVPVHIASDLAPAKIRAYRLADNRAHEEATWDEDLLRLELNDLKGDVDLNLTGFDEAEIIKMLNTTPRETKPQLGTTLAYSVIIRCADEGEQQRLLTRFEKEGHECQALIS